MENGQSGAAKLSAEARRVHARLYFNAKEAEFGAAQGRARPPHEWNRSYNLYPWRGTQSAGALDRPHPRRTRERSAGRALSRGPGRARYRRRREPEAGPLEIRRETA